MGSLSRDYNGNETCKQMTGTGKHKKKTNSHIHTLNAHRKADGN